MIYEPRDGRTIGLGTTRDTARSYEYQVILATKNGEVVLDQTNNPTDGHRIFANAKFDAMDDVKSGICDSKTVSLKYVRKDGFYEGEIGKSVKILWCSGTERVMEAFRVSMVDGKVKRENLLKAQATKKVRSGKNTITLPPH